MWLSLLGFQLNEEYHQLSFCTCVEAFAGLRFCFFECAKYFEFTHASQPAPRENDLH